MDKLGQCQENPSTPLKKAQLESDLLKTNRDIAPLIGEILQGFVCWGYRLLPTIYTNTVDGPITEGTYKWGGVGGFIIGIT